MIVFFFVCVSILTLFAHRAAAQDDRVVAIASVPADALSFHAKVMPALQPAVHRWIVEQVANARRDKTSARSLDSMLRASIPIRFAGQKVDSMSVAGLVHTVLVEHAKQSDADLNALVQQMKTNASVARSMRELHASLKQVVVDAAEHPDEIECERVECATARAKMTEIASAQRKARMPSVIIATDIRTYGEAGAVIAHLEKQLASVWQMIQNLDATVENSLAEYQRTLDRIAAIPKRDSDSQAVIVRSLR